MSIRAINQQLQIHAIRLLALLLFVVYSATANATFISTFVSPMAGGKFYSSGEYEFVSISMNLNPGQTNWLAVADSWSQTDPEPYACSSPTSSLCLGRHGFGTDDYYILTITNPGGTSASVTMDQNDSSANSYGPQMIIYGSATDAPDVRRSNLSGYTTYFNEAGAFNALGIFSVAGLYTFDFSFRNQYCCDAGHINMYLLADVNQAVPEPNVLLLFGIGLVTLIGYRLRLIRDNKRMNLLD